MTHLNTFGAIMGFAIDMEARIAAMYTTAGAGDRAADADKRRKTLERVRRENVTEIKLETIDGLIATNYAFDDSLTDDAGLRAAADAAARFYADVAPKINVREAQRALERCGSAHRAIADA